MTRSRKVLWALAAGVVAVVTVSSLGGLPSATDMVSGAESARNEAAILVSQGVQADEALGQREAFAADLTAARQAVPPTPELSALISDLEAQAGAAGLVWVSGSPSRTVREEREQWQISMTVTGSPTAVAQFTGDIREAPRLLVVDTLSLQSSPEGGVTANMTVRFFTALGEIQSFPEEQRAEIESGQPTNPQEEGQ